MVGNEADSTANVDEPRYRQLVEHVHDAVVEFELVRGDPVVWGVNDAFVDTFGYAADSLRGESLNDWIVPEWCSAESQRPDERTASGEVSYRQVERKTADGIRGFL
jgi:PAS domain S-box-containing protein